MLLDYEDFERDVASTMRLVYSFLKIRVDFSQLVDQLKLFCNK